MRSVPEACRCLLELGHADPQIAGCKQQPTCILLHDICSTDLQTARLPNIVLCPVSRLPSSPAHLLRRSICRPILDGLPSYELGEEAYAANEAERTWVQQLLGTLGQCLTWLQPMLTPDNHDSLVACILDKVSLGRVAGPELVTFSGTAAAKHPRAVPILAAAHADTRQS